MISLNHKSKKAFVKYILLIMLSHVSYKQELTKTNQAYLLGFFENLIKSYCISTEKFASSATTS